MMADKPLALLITWIFYLALYSLVGNQHIVSLINRQYKLKYFFSDCYHKHYQITSLGSSAMLIELALQMRNPQSEDGWNHIAKVTLSVISRSEKQNSASWVLGFHSNKMIISLPRDWAPWGEIGNLPWRDQGHIIASSKHWAERASGETLIFFQTLIYFLHRCDGLYV